MRPPPSGRSPRSGSANISRRELLAAVSVGGLMAALAGPAIGASPAPQTAWAACDRKEALDAVINDAVGGGQIVGATVIAAKNGEIVYQRAAGFSDREAERRMKEDEICRLASMTKPIVCVHRSVRYAKDASARHRMIVASGNHYQSSSAVTFIETYRRYCSNKRTVSPSSSSDIVNSQYPRT